MTTISEWSSPPKAEEAQDTPVEKGGNPETQEEPKIGDTEQPEKNAKVGEDQVNKDTCLQVCE